MITRQQALDYHSRGKRGKVEVNPTKPCVTQLDLSLAYTPGVALPCLEIHQNPDDVYTYTAKGNLVAGANIAGFLKVAKAMMAQGVV